MKYNIGPLTNLPEDTQLWKVEVNTIGSSLPSYIYVLSKDQKEAEDFANSLYTRSYNAHATPLLVYNPIQEPKEEPDPKIIEYAEKFMSDHKELMHKLANMEEYSQIPGDGKQEEDEL